MHQSKNQSHSLPGDVGMWSAFPESIGRLTLGEKLSSDHYCGGSHEMPNGHPIYWQQRGGEYPDDIEGYCLACAITNAESEAGWCECSTRAALTPSPCPGDGMREDDPARILKSALFALEKNKAEPTVYGGVLTDHGKRAWIAYGLFEQDARPALTPSALSGDAGEGRARKIARDVCDRRSLKRDNGLVYSAALEAAKEALGLSPPHEGSAK